MTDDRKLLGEVSRMDNIVDRLIGAIKLYIGRLTRGSLKRRYQFSPEGAAELTAFHKRICESLQVAFGVFMTGDVEAARRLIREKAELRGIEPTAGDRHFERLREGRPESIETSSRTSTSCATSGHPLACLLGRLPGSRSGWRIARTGDSGERIINKSLLPLYCSCYRSALAPKHRKNGLRLAPASTAGLVRLSHLGSRLASMRLAAYAKPRELTVLYDDNDAIPCACFADGVAIATHASVGQRTLTIARRSCVEKLAFRLRLPFSRANLCASAICAAVMRSETMSRLFLIRMLPFCAAAMSIHLHIVLWQALAFGVMTPRLDCASASPARRNHITASG